MALDEEVNTKNRLADDRRRLKMEHKRVKEMLEKEVNEYKKQFQDDKMSRVELERYLIYINNTYPSHSLSLHIFIISLYPLNVIDYFSNPKRGNPNWKRNLPR